jgi:hypothetical protein
MSVESGVGALQVVAGEGGILINRRPDRQGRKRALESTAPIRQQYSIVKQRLRSPLGLRNDFKVGG